MSDPRTLAVYNSQDNAYAAMMDREAARDPIIGYFIAACPKGGRVLDIGCGAGHYARKMAEAGLRVDALDAAAAMVARTGRIPGVNARLGRFEDLADHDIYDGIWAYFSLLHAPRADFSAHLGRIAKALRPDGTFFIGLKRGQGNARDRLDRYYEYYEEDELQILLRAAGMEPMASWTGKATGLAGHPEGWIAMQARRRAA